MYNSDIKSDEKALLRNAGKCIERMEGHACVASPVTEKAVVVPRPASSSYGSPFPYKSHEKRESKAYEEKEESDD